MTPRRGLMDNIPYNFCSPYLCRGSRVHDDRLSTLYTTTMSPWQVATQTSAWPRTEASTSLPIQRPRMGVPEDSGGYNRCLWAAFRARRMAVSIRGRPGVMAPPPASSYVPVRQPARFRSLNCAGNSGGSWVGVMSLADGLLQTPVVEPIAPLPRPTLNSAARRGTGD